MSRTRIALICGHRYGRRLAEAMAAAPLDFIHAFVLHPSNVHRYGGYESPLSTLDRSGVRFTFFDDVASLETRQHWLQADPHYVLVCGLRQLLPVEMLWRVARNNDERNVSSERSGFICFHPSDLPDGAGMAPVQWTLFERASEGTVASFFIDDVGIDGGPVIAKREFPIEVDDDAGDLDRKIGDQIAALFNELVPALAARAVQSMPQSQLPIPRRVRPQTARSDRWIDFSHSMDRISLQVRAFAKPYGGSAALIEDQAYLIYECAPDPERLGIGECRRTSGAMVVGCKDGAIRITAYEAL